MRSWLKRPVPACQRLNAVNAASAYILRWARISLLGIVRPLNWPIHEMPLFDGIQILNLRPFGPSSRVMKQSIP